MRNTDQRHQVIRNVLQSVVWRVEAVIIDKVSISGCSWILAVCHLLVSVTHPSDWLLRPELKHGIVDVVVCC